MKPFVGGLCGVLLVVINVQTTFAAPRPSVSAAPAPVQSRPPVAAPAPPTAPSSTAASTPSALTVDEAREVCFPQNFSETNSDDSNLIVKLSDLITHDYISSLSIHSFIGSSGVCGTDAEDPSGSWVDRWLPCRDDRVPVVRIHASLMNSVGSLKYCDYIIATDSMSEGLQLIESIFSKAVDYLSATTPKGEKACMLEGAMLTCRATIEINRTFLLEELKQGTMPQ